MNILLTAINAKYIHSNLAVYSLRAYAQSYKRDIQLGEFTINQRTEYILQEIYKKKPDVLCFSCYIWNIDYVLEVAEEYHKICPEIPIWAGGPEVSYETEIFLEKYPFITGIMMVEGEKIFFHLCAYYKQILEPEEVIEKEHLTLDKIKGIAYRSALGRVQVNPWEIPLDMSTIPFCYEDLSDFEKRIIYYESSRGCPFSCSYCLSSIDKTLRFRNLDLVKQELQFFINQKVPQVKFVDRTFNCKHEHAMEIWQFIKEQDKGITNFHFEISADLLTEEEISLIQGMRPGLIQLEVGVQSTNPATIQEIHRTMMLEMVEDIVQKVQKNGNIHEHLDLIAGLPFEDYTTFAKSFDEIYALKPNQLQLGFLKVLKGSYMYEHAAEYGVKYHSRAPYEILESKWLSYEDVLRIKQVEEMLEVYYNSGQFEVTMKILEKERKSAFALFQSMGEFYEEKGYFQVKHTRIRRSEILLEYVEQVLHKDIKLYEEALLFDLFYRENLKSRPKWAADDKRIYKMNRIYCKNGKLSHVEPFHYHFPGKETRTIVKQPVRSEKLFYALFEYDKRDPLDNQAKVSWIEVNEDEVSC